MWLNKEVRQAINSKKKAFALLKQDGTIEALKNYREKNTLSKKLIKAAKKETEKHIAKESKTNPKLFFNYINSKRIKTENVGPLKNSEERMVVDDKEKANILNTFFSTVFTVENEMLGEIPRNNENPILRVTNLTQEEVRNRLNKIKIDKSPGPDGIHPRVLRELSNFKEKATFSLVETNFGGNSKADNYEKLVENLLKAYKDLGCKVQKRIDVLIKGQLSAIVEGHSHFYYALLLQLQFSPRWPCSPRLCLLMAPLWAQHSLFEASRNLHGGSADSSPRSQECRAHIITCSILPRAPWMMSSETFSFNATEAAEILSKVTAPSDFLQIPAKELKNRDLERESRRAVNLELHIITIAEYLRVQRIPRGLRVPLQPTFFREDKDYCTKFEHILNKCSADLMTLTLSYLQKNLETVNAQINAIETQLTSTLPQEEFQELKTKNQEILRSHRSELEKRKRSKFLRDTEDYLQNRVYQWRDTQHSTRRHSSLSSSGSIDSRPGTSNSFSSHSSSFLGNNRSRPKRKTRRGGQCRRGTQKSYGNTLTGKDLPLVVNISSKNLDTHQLAVLQKGLSFCPMYKFNSFELNMDLQRFYRNIRLRVHFSEQPAIPICSGRDKTLLELRDLGLRTPSSYMPPRSNPPVETFVSLVERDIHTLTREMDRGKFQFHTNLTQAERLSLEQLSSDKSLIIKPADKGGATVIMDRSDYLEEVFRQLGDTTVYKKIPQNPLNQLINKIAPIIDFHYQAGTIDVKTTRSFLLDTNDFIQVIKSLGPISPSSLLITWDVNSLYTSIVHEKGLAASDRLLHDNKIDIKIRHLCADLLGLVLKENYFLFQDTFYAQQQGTAMGANVAPPYAVAYMAIFEQDFVYDHPLFMSHCRVWRRYIDDIFCIWDGPIESLLSFDQHINGLASWTLWSTRKKGGDHLAIDLYTKPTDRNGLLLFTSCHPPSIKNSIPKSQFHRVDRIVSDENLKQTRLIEMEHKFIDRGYPKGILSEAKRNMSSSKTRDISKRIPFVTTFHPFSGLVQSTIRRHWNILSKSYPNIAEFRLPFLSCFKRARNLKDRLVKADIGPSTLLPKQVFLHTQKRGTFPCLNCLQCSNVQKGPSVFHPQTGKAIPIKGFYTCESTFVVYIIKCPCGLAYIGETTQAVRDRVAQHKSTIRCNKAHLPLPFHFSEKNHNIAQLRFQVLEQVDIPRRGQNRTKMLQKREAYWIYIRYKP
ncbi:unnamed protein product [Ranitomeya imitator]|uniref:Reverse transcriptase domain-containing protein n=1 Tax=Ranitomeya imitator TaxID=111125 RepID=A0ABN9MEU2_9NEOB|nr:unnamed protein product [Ranitomeya imitator]